MSAVARRYFIRGHEQLKSGDSMAACNEFAAALELLPTYTEARVAFALTLAPSDPPRAAQALRTGLSRRPSPRAERQLQLALGDVLLLGGDYPGAEGAYRAADQLSSDEEKAELHRRWATLRAKTGKFAEALSEMLHAARVK